MAEAKQREMQVKVDDLVRTIDSERLRPLRKSAFLTMAKCCDLDNPKAYQQCVARAGQPEQQASGVIQKELGEFQQRLQRASMACQDEVKDRGFKDQVKAQNAFNSCINGALDKHMKLLRAAGVLALENAPLSPRLRARAGRPSRSASRVSSRPLRHPDGQKNVYRRGGRRGGGGSRGRLF